MYVCFADSHVWYFDSGATKHITSQRDMFTCLESLPVGNSVTCTNNSEYPVRGVGKIVLTVAMLWYTLRTAEALFPSLGGFPPVHCIYAQHSRATLSLFLHT